MKIINIFICLLFLSTAINLKAQNRSALGLNMQPFYLLEGNLEGVLYMPLYKKLFLKMSLGGTRSSGNFRLTCKVDDQIEHRKETGGFFKLNPNYTVGKIRSADFYCGLMYFFTDFKTSGEIETTHLPVSNEGRIVTYGITSGIKKNITKHIMFDFGIQILFHKWRTFQVGSECKGYVPGMGPTGVGSGGILQPQIYANIMLRP